MTKKIRLTLPRRVWRHTWGPYGIYWTPRGEWLVRQTVQRFERKHGPREEIQVEIGTWNGFTIHQSEPPAGLQLREEERLRLGEPPRMLQSNLTEADLDALRRPDGILLILEPLVGPRKP